MKLDKQILEEKIRKHRETKSCSESTLMGLCETAEADITTEQMTNWRVDLQVEWAEHSMKEPAVQ